MTRPVSILLPALDTRDLLERNLPAVLDEVRRRGVGDEILVVDDTGADVLAPWLATQFPSVRVVAQPENTGFARAILAGARAAEHALCLSLNTDVHVRPGFLDPLVAALDDSSVAAVSPRVLLHGDESRAESETELFLRQGLLAIERVDEDGPGPTRDRTRQHEVPFVVGGTMLFRRDEFLALGGFDPLYEPFYLEDVDLCWMAWTNGRRVVVEPQSVVDHDHRGTIGRRVDPAVVRAAIERNRMLFLWKHLDDDELLREHLDALARRAADAWMIEDRETLVWMALALEDRAAALESRRAHDERASGFAAILERLRR